MNAQGMLRLAAMAVVISAVNAMEVRFVTSFVPEGVEEVTVVQKGKASDPFGLSTHGVSQVVKVSSRVFTLNDATDKSVLAQVVLPAGASEFLVLLARAPEDAEAPYEAVVLEDSKRAFPPGRIYLHNATGEIISCKLDEEVFTVQPGTGELIRPRPAGGKKAYSVEITSRPVVPDDAGEGEAKVSVISRSRWPVSESMRRYIFFHVGGRRNRIEFHAVDEFVQP